MAANLKVTNFPKQIAFLILLIVGVLLVGILGFSYSENVGVTGAFGMTVDSIAFKHTGSNMLSESLSTFLGAIGVIIIWFAIWSAFGMAVEGKFSEYFSEVRMKNEISSMKNHFIICGAGRVGKHVGLRLRQRGEAVLFLEKDKDNVAKLQAEGFTVMVVSTIEEHTLRQAQIQHAKGIIACLGDDSKNLLLVLTAKELAPHISVAARVSDMKIVQKFKRAGATHIIMPEATGGVRLADSLLGNHSHDVMRSD